MANPELVELKKRADQIGLSYKFNVGVKKLREAVNAQLNKEPAQVVAEKQAEADLPVQPIPNSPVSDFKSPDTPTRKRETPVQKKMRLRKKAVRLIRFRLTCMNPNKKGHTAGIFVTGNKAVGTIKRVIPFNADAWHCEEMLLNMIQDKQFIDFYTVKDRKGRVMKKHRLVKEFAIEILPPLTANEIVDLKAQQQQANNIGD